VQCGSVAVGSIAVDDLATQLYVDPGDVCVILATLTVETVEDVWVPRSVSRTLISGFAVGRPQHHRPGLRLHDRRLWPSDSPTLMLARGHPRTGTAREGTARANAIAERFIGTLRSMWSWTSSAELGCVRLGGVRMAMPGRLGPDCLGQSGR
jgi:transposase InsO family protein